ncbi:hypothetical protein M231_02905 [Tremella mesenterica]|uniref:POT family proton-dependent oligopeptide transporter n=1 Tax=Tremella mesenterica TaxID=5217 RepID=A0A4Q1BPL9_TREME|nr:hypothetical protein M231_02905 [Tremella mesenterica]
MSHLTIDFESAPVPSSLPGTDQSGHVLHEKPINEKDLPAEITVSGAEDLDSEQIPTEEEMMSLRKVPGGMPFVCILMCLVELAERASYYGSTSPFNNFINNPLPVGGNGAGAVAKGSLGKQESTGALGLGSKAASGLVNSFQFLAYVIPIYGGIVADTKWGRFKTICVGVLVGIISHILLVIPAIPSVLKHPNGALGSFIVALYILSFASGFIKPCLGPLLLDNSPVRVPSIIHTKKGERVILDPQATAERYMLIFYGCINIGAFFTIATSYTERYVGFWLTFLLPGLIYLLMPIILYYCNKRLYKAPPQGSVVLEAFKVFKVLLSDGGWKRMWKGGDNFWNRAKPSYIEARDGGLDIDKVFWDDKFVDELKQSLRACQVFMLIPVFTLADGGIGNQVNSMSTAMTLDGVPNDLYNSFNSLAIIIATPIITYGIYPFFSKIGRPVKPMTRMCIGFLLGAIGAAIAAIVQWRIYKTSPCGYSASTCDAGVSPISLWWQVPIICIPAVGEIFVNPVSYELAYTRSPARMKGLVYALALFNTAVAYAISLALAGVITDPFLIWPWVALAGGCFVLAILIPIYWKDLNEPVSAFADKTRMEGFEQPKVLLEHQHEMEQTRADDVGDKI